MKTISVLFFTTIFAIQTANAQQKSHSHTEHLDVLIEHYLVMKSALVQDDFVQWQIVLKRSKLSVRPL